MEALNPNQLLLIYSWFPVSALLLILLLIARFYQNLTSEQTYYYLFLVPILLYGIAIAHYASLNQVMGDSLGDLLLFLAGGILFVLCVRLYRRMTIGR